MPRRISGPSDTTATSRSAHGRAARARAQRQLLELGGPRDQAAAADHLLVPGDLDHAAAGLLVGGAHGRHDFRERDAEAAQAIRVDLHLVLAHEAADRRDLGDPRHARERVAQVPVLEAAQLAPDRCLPLRSTSAYSKTQPTPVASGPSVGVTPSGRRAPAVLRYSSTRLRAQYEIGAVLEDHVHEGEAEEGLPAHVAHVRRRDQRRRDRIGDLIFDQRRARAPATR